MAYRPGKCLLHNILREKRLTPQELSEQIGIPKQQLSNYANNRNKMNLANAKTIAHHLEIPIDDLYEWIKTTRKRRRKNLE
jgi:transcriptional regulator with XRE-family HTH domain